MTRRIALIITTALAIMLGGFQHSDAHASSLIYYAAGDIACAPGFTVTTTKCHHAGTAVMIPTSGVNGVITLGDNQYGSGLLSEFTGSGTFNATWGTPFASILHPVSGNHEYLDTIDNNAGVTGAHLAGYKQDMTNLGVTWGSPLGSANCPTDANGRPCDWYSFNQGQWHFIMLDSECTKLVPPDSAGGCSTAGKEYKWLVADLDAINQTTQPCLIVAWHRPRWSSGGNGNFPSIDAFWQLLANGTPTQNGGTPRLGPWTADLVINGHDHDYERFARKDALGASNAAGIREIVVGTGGDDLGVFPGAGGLIAGSEQHVNTDFGVLKLTLNASAYFAQWFSESGLVNGTQVNNGCHV